MKKYFKKFVNFLLIMVLIFVLISCGSEEKIYKVTFQSQGETVNLQDVKSGELATYYGAENGDHELVAWHVNSLEGASYDFTTPVTAELLLVAEWTSTVTLVNEDGTEIETLEVKKGETFEPTELPKKKSDESYTYAFKGWDHELVGTGEDLTIKAQFEKTAIVRTVTFYDKGNNQVGTLEVANGEAIGTGFNYQVQDDQYYKYELVGWTNSKGEDFDFSTPITANTNLYIKTKRTPLPMDFTGKTISMLGDSVSTFYVKGDPMCSYYGGDNQFYYPRYCSAVSSGSKTYWGQLINKLGLKLGINESYSGTTCYGSGNTVACSNYRIGHLDDNGTPDIIIVFIGINDNASGYTNEQFRTAYKAMLGKIEALYPTSYTFCVLHPYSNYHLNQPTNHMYYSETTRLNYNNIITQLADEFQFGLIHLDEAQTTENWKTLLADNLHPNQLGHDAWYAQCLKDINNYFNQTSETTTIQYKTLENSKLSDNAVTEFKVGDIFTLPTVAKSGYTFNGWYLESDFSGNKVTDTSKLGKDTILYAEQNQTPTSGKMYVRYVYNGGLKEGCTIDTNVDFEIVSKVTYTLPNAVKEGYKFDGWFTNPEFSGSRIYTVKDNSKVYAKWTKID